MAGTKYRIVGLPKAKEGMHVTQKVPRGEANVEAEKGETMITRDNVSNQKKLVSIGGKKHSEGGTPLSAEPGSAIFSDYLKIKDPMILKFFNETGKKPKTFADISKKYKISEWSEERKEENNDKITNASLDKNLDNANFKLSALFTVQEFHEKKGSPEEHSKHFEPFLERMGLDYEEILGTSGQEGQEGAPPKMAKYGTQVRLEEKIFDKLPMAKRGDAIKSAPPYGESNAYGDTGVERLNKYLKIYNIAELKKGASKAAIQAKVKEAQAAAFAKNPDLILDFMTTDTESDEKSHQPNIKLQKIMQDVAGSKVTPTGPNGAYSNVDLRAMMEEGTITNENVTNAYGDGKWWYRMVNSNIKDVSETEMVEKQKMLDEKGIKQGDLNYLYIGDGYYEAYRTKPDGTLEQVEPDPAVVDELYQWEVDPMDASPERAKNMDFLWSNKRALKQAKKAKRDIPYLEPFTATEDVTYAEQAYYSPDQAINAIQSLSGAQGTKQAMFAPQQQQVANSMAGQQFELMGKVIGNYEDKNVAAYNQEQLVNTNIANQASTRLASAITGHHDKYTKLKQQFANAKTNADNNIAENEIAMWQERADRLNLEATIGEQYAKNPNTGVQEFIKGKDFAPNSSSSKTVADTYNDLAKTLPAGTPPATISKLALAEHSGKYNVQKVDPPQSSQYQ
tara:strand:+ start:2950 stop:4983 length:2034 start_codon:yes stop_codon:yes gene_type:complete